ncbi:MAG TPA: alpha/beta hydrolase [Jatrophihabitans sp.]|nr:alpha/beta hydrolase [Jatrophihabitans sp.]
MTITVPRRIRSAAPPPTSDDGAAARKGRIGLVVAASLLSGPVGALILTLGVFAGASEHVITGSALLAFAASWAMLAGLSTRWTSQPQRWALLPAGYLAAVGTGLLVLAPSSATLTAAGWLWPVGLVALTAWIVIRSRRSLRSRSRRWLLYPVCALMALAAVGGSVETVLESVSRPTPSAGRTYDVAGHRMYLRCEGTGSPTVLLSNGAGERSSSWAWITPAVARDTRVCSYDRAGQGWSDSAGPQDGVALATDLHTLLRVAQVPGPYLLAGHSVGGVYNMTFAARYPDETAGMVLLDSATPDQFALPSYPGVYYLWRRASSILPSLARLGAVRVSSGTAFGGLPARPRSDERAFASDPGTLRGQDEEWAQLPTAFTQARALHDFGAKPLIVLTAGRGAQTGWFAAQDKLAALSTNAAHRTLMAASHSALLEEEQFAAYSSQAIRDVVTAIRTGTHVIA